MSPLQLSKKGKHWRAARLHGRVAAISLALCTLAYCAPHLFDRTGAPVLLDGRPQSISEVRFGTPQEETLLVCDGGHVTEVRLITRGADANDAPKEIRLRPSPEADTFLSRLAPLRSERVLGQQDDAHLSLFGLSEPSAPHLRVHGHHNNLDLTLGKSLYGAQSHYAYAENFGVVVLQSLMLREFDHGAAALWDNHILPPLSQDMSEIRLRVGEKLCAFVQSQQGAQRRWQPALGTNEGGQNQQASAVEGALSLIHGLTFLQAATPQQVAHAAAASLGKSCVIELYNASGHDKPTSTVELWHDTPLSVVVGSHPLQPVTLSASGAQSLTDAIHELCPSL